METFGDDKKFFQGLIQAAVGLCHFCNGNVRGAAKLYRSSRDYMQRYASPFWGLDQEAFWGQMERCFAPILVERRSAKRDRARRGAAAGDRRWSRRPRNGRTRRSIWKKKRREAEVSNPAAHAAGLAGPPTCNGDAS